MSAAIDLTARAIILLCLAAVVTTALRRRTASLRALVWTAALGGVLLLPAVSQLTPAWRMSWWSARAEAVAIAPASLPADVLQRPTTDPGSTAPATTAAIGDGTGAFAEPARNFSWDWNQAALFGLLIVTLLLLTRLALSHARLARLSRSSQRIDDGQWAALVDDVRGRLAINRSVDIRISGAVNVPAVAGLLAPTLLLPVDAREWTPDEQRAIVLHELAHVARWDALAQLVGQIACAVYWFLPLVWFAARRAAALRERASDDEVLRAGVRPAAYAESLLRLARAAGGAELQPATLAMARPSRMRERVQAILDPALRRTALHAPMTLLVLALSGATLGAVAAIAPAADTPSEPVREIVLIGEQENAPTTSALPDTPDAPTRKKPAPPPAQGTPRLCGDRGLDSSSTSITEENGTRRWKVKLEGDRCTVDLRAEGRLDFTADFSDVSAIGPGGFFRLDVTDGGVRRQLEIEPRDGSLARTWRIDGREAPYDAAARAWFAAFLVELDRRTAIGVDIRLPHLLKQGGVDAVLAETALISSDYARGQYYTRLARTTTLSAADVTRIFRQAAALTTSDHYANAVIEAFASRGVADADQRAAILGLIEGMKSDHYRATSIEKLVAGRQPGAAEMDVLLRMVPRMTSDHYKVQTLTTVLRGGRLTSPQQAALARVTASIESDHYIAQFLKAITSSGPMDEPVRDAYLEAVGRIESDHYANAVLTSLLGARNLAERDLLGIVARAASLSDHYESDTLQRILRHEGVTDRVRAAAVDAAQKMSSHYANEVRRAAGR